MAAAPNDPSFPLQWGDSNTGQSIPTQGVAGKEPLGPRANGTPGADDRGLAAWGVTRGSPSIVIAELDTGVEYNHPDLSANIWSNPGGVGGCASGTHGYNVLDHTCEPIDEDTAYEGHGTHVAGIMGGVGNNGIGVAGMNWQTTILPVKWLESADTETGALLEALEWVLRAKQQGVNIRVVNDSPTFLGTLRSEALKKEIEVLGANNILFVAAAGNSGSNNDEEAVRRYPCAYQLWNELCVTATDNRDALPSWANYGPKTVDLAAPGVSIYSTLRGQRYGYLTGGSMASAQVAGAAALILAREPTLSTTQLKDRILKNVRPDPALAGKVGTGGVLDVCKAMAGCKESAAPIAATGVASSVTQTTATVNATVNPSGQAVSDCHFDYGVTSSYGSSVPCTPRPGSGTSAVAVSASVTDLGQNTTYHFRVVATNPQGTSSGADVTFTTPPNPPAPAVSTGVASSATPTAATLNATVNPNGATVSDCHFEYGVTTTYGSGAPCTPEPGSGTNPVDVSASITGLSPSTTYHFRILATNARGTSKGTDVTFTTLADSPLPTVLTGAASSATPTVATLDASVNPNGATVSDCHFEYGVTPAYGSNVPCTPQPGSGTSPVAVSASITGLSPGTNYHFRVVATNPGGTAVAADQTFMTAPLAPVPQLTPAETAMTPASPGTLASALASPPARATLAAMSLSVNRWGTVSIKIRCPGTVGICTGTLALRTLPAATAPSAPRRKMPQPAIVILAVGGFRVAGGTVETAKLHLSPAGRRLVHRTRPLRARATIVTGTRDGSTEVTETTVLLRSAR
ncbi:MAG TPA: S8 family serine peptidase [Solirubrobacteraceae bacterium]|nr:S8 family serine peptidase [Solirubrobacteraceae bacterium]